MPLNSKESLFDSSAVESKPVSQPQCIQQCRDVFLIDLEMESDGDDLPAIFSGQSGIQETSSMVTSEKENGKLPGTAGPTERKLCWVWPEGTSSVGTGEEENEQSIGTGKSSIQKISWIWPELGRRDAICEEIEKSLYCDKESVTLDEKRRQLVMKMKGVHIRGKSRKVQSS